MKKGISRIPIAAVTAIIAGLCLSGCDGSQPTIYPAKDSGPKTTQQTQTQQTQNGK